MHSGLVMLCGYCCTALCAVDYAILARCVVMASSTSTIWWKPNMCVRNVECWTRTTLSFSKLLLRHSCMMLHAYLMAFGFALLNLPKGSAFALKEEAVTSCKRRCIEERARKKSREVKGRGIGGRCSAVWFQRCSMSLCQAYTMAWLCRPRPQNCLQWVHTG